MTACPVGHDSVATDYCDVCGRRMDAPSGPAGAGSTGAGSGGAGSAATGAGSAGIGSAEAAPGPATALCPRCHAVRSGRFCEGCGLDLDARLPADLAGNQTSAELAGTGLGAGSTGSSVTSASPLGHLTGAGAASHTAGDQAGSPAPAAWSAVATADRAYYDTVMASGGPDAAAVSFPAYCPERTFALTGREMRIGRRSASRGLTPEIDLTGPPLDPGISRLHAVLVTRPGSGWAVVDPGSENGTLVNGNEIATGVLVPLRDGDRIHLGAWTMITLRQSDSAEIE